MATLRWTRYAGYRIPAPGFRALVSGTANTNTARHAYVWEQDGNWVSYIEVLKDGSIVDVSLGMRMSRDAAERDVFAFIGRESERAASPAKTKRPSMYQEMIVKDLGIKAEMYDPRHVEAYMRLERGTLDGLSRQSWAIELEQATLCIDAGGTVQAEELAKSYGL